MADIVWLRPDATPMDAGDWSNGYAKALMVFMNGEAVNEPDIRGKKIVDDSFLLMFNADSSDIDFTLPPTEPGTKWEAALDTDGTTARARNKLVAGGILSVTGRSLVVL